ncbi:MAG: hypothetical protein CM1200mP34_2470 [Verrucomicrobiales bacterium]|nr:MAG: hypothetical protein CM1200mP34_2470 [Verrucomicrobiales bacterium]
MRWFFSMGLMVILLVGCATNTITNLTPRELPWSQTGLYPVEAMYKSNLRTLDPASIKPIVIFNNQAFPKAPNPAHRGPLGNARADPGGTRVINYHFKFDYEYSAVMMRGRQQTFAAVPAPDCR